MLELIAIGPEPEMRWRRKVSPGRRIRLGRAPAKGWSVPWDLRISREHADIVLEDGQLSVRCLDTARNLPFFNQERAREFSIEPGQHFRIGLTVFRLEHPGADSSEATVCEDVGTQIPPDPAEAAPTPGAEVVQDNVQPEVGMSKPVKRKRGDRSKTPRHDKARPKVPSNNAQAQRDDEFDPYHRWLGIPASEQPADYYRLLGLSRFESDPDVIQAAADRQMTHVRTYQTGPRAKLSQTILNEVTRAKLCLLIPEKKAEYDLKLEQEAIDAPPKPASTEPPAPPQDSSTSVNLANFLDQLSEEDQHWKKKR